MAMQMRCEGFSEEDATRSIKDILEATCLCSMATRNADGTCHINIAYFAYDDELILCFLSVPATKHCRNLAFHAQAAMTVFSTEQPWGEVDLKGIQLFGSAAQAEGEAAAQAEEVYRRRFPAQRCESRD